MMQTPIPQELSALMALEQGMRQGQVSPTTPDGSPTVAAQLAGAAKQQMSPQMSQQMSPQQMSPAVNQIAQQAGLASQIQAMQQQQAQQALMQQAMQQGRPSPMDAGIAAAPGAQAVRMADGGIVGYAPGGGAEDEAFVPPSELGGGIEYRERETEEEHRRRLAEERAAVIARLDRETQAAREQVASEGFRRGDPRSLASMPTAAQQLGQEMPPPEERVQRAAPRPAGQPSAAPAPGGVAALFEQQRKGLEGMKGPATPEEILANERRTRAVKDEYLRSIGIDPDMFTKREAEDKKLMDEQRALLRERMERERAADTPLSRVAAALRGFRQMKGQGAGQGMLSAYANLENQVQSGQMRMDQLRDFELQLNQLDINTRRALDDARRATAEGRWNDAAKDMANATAFDNRKKELIADTYGKQAPVMVQERQVQEMAAGRNMDQRRIQEMYQLRLNTITGGKQPTDSQKLEAMEYALQAVKGAAGAARAHTAADALAIKRQELAEKNPAYKLAQMTAFSTSPSVTEERKQQARQVMRQLEAQYGIAEPAAASPQGGSQGFKLLSVQPAPR